MRSAETLRLDDWKLHIDLTLTEPLVSATGVGSFLDQIPSGIPLPVEANYAIATVEAELESQPVVTVTIAQNVAAVESTVTGITSAASGVTITISGLGEIL